MLSSLSGSLRIFLCACTCVHECVRICVRASVHVFGAYERERMCVCVCYLRARVRLCVRVRVCVCMHTCRCVCVRASVSSVRAGPEPKVLRARAACGRCGYAWVPSVRIVSTLRTGSTFQPLEHVLSTDPVHCPLPYQRSFRGAFYVICPVFPVRIGASSSALSSLSSSTPSGDRHEEDRRRDRLPPPPPSHTRT